MLKVARWEIFPLKMLVGSGIFVILVIFLFLFTSEGSDAATITVDDDAPADYSRIQDAINASLDGDTVYVFNGTYYENLIINKSLTLIGEDRNTTIINGSEIGNVIYVNENWVNISGFTVMNGGWYGDGYGCLELYQAINCTFFDLILFDGFDFGLSLTNSQNVTLRNTNIKHCYWGVKIVDSNYNNIIENDFNTRFNLIYIKSSYGNRIYHNNFNVTNDQGYVHDDGNNFWDNGYPFGGNYWSDYTGKDSFNGPNQDLPGNDGIGDEPYLKNYLTDVGNRDNYPLINLIGDIRTTHDYDGFWNPSDFTIILMVIDGFSGVNETYYRVNNGPIKIVSIDGQPFIFEESDNNTLEYWSIDNAGNKEEHKFLYSIKLDKTSPFSADDYDGLEHHSDFVITLTAIDELSAIEDIFFRINDGAVLSVSINGQPTIEVESKNNSLEYWSMDVAGNIEDHHFLYGIILNKTYPDLTLTTADIIFSKPRLIEGTEVYINTTIHNIGNLSAQVTVKLFNGEAGTGSLIGETIVQVEGQDSEIASFLWTPLQGLYNIHVLISDSIPYEPFTDNNGAKKSVTVEIPPVLVLSVGDINIFRFESGEERTVPVYVSCYNNSATIVRLVVIDDRGLNITVVTPPQNMSKDKATIFFLRIKVPVLKEDEEYKEEDILLQVISDEVSGNTESMDIIVGRSATEFFGWILLIGGAVVGAGVVGFIGGTEIGKFALFAAAMSLYTRLKRDDILDQETRGMIRGYILANPGEHYNAIKRALGLKNGTLAYHLKTLEKEKLIKSARDGRFKRFFPPNMKIPEDVFTLNKIQEIILGEIIKAPGISQKELAEAVGQSTSTINYHIGVMTNAGFVLVKRKGKHTMCYPGNGVA